MLPFNIARAFNLHRKLPGTAQILCNYLEAPCWLLHIPGTKWASRFQSLTPVFIVPAWNMKPHFITVDLIKLDRFSHYSWLCQLSTVPPRHPHPRLLGLFCFAIQGRKNILSLGFSLSHLFFSFFFHALPPFSPSSLSSPHPRLLLPPPHFFTVSPPSPLSSPLSHPNKPRIQQIMFLAHHVIQGK